ncbi:ceramide kinase-like isoform X2 [Musa acuminata AAA Group]|uniref:ceramide kinase-like isoform X2 n=1 Tax=Musa acuminata AAA Group TaxID=214697 RepID=UPI0031E4692C
MERNGSASTSISTLFLDRVGEVAVTLDPDGLSWKPIDCESSGSSCLCMNYRLKTENRIEFSSVYAVDLIDWGLIEDANRNSGSFFSGNKFEMYRFVVHGFHRGKTHGSPWTLCEYTFGHKDMHICQSWVERLIASTSTDAIRPKSLLVFVHPLCGKGNGVKTWETVAPIFSHAKVRTEVTVTQRAGHAFDCIASLSHRELSSFDGIVAVGGDGLFNEVLNGLLSSRHDAPYPPSPQELDNKSDKNFQHLNNDISCGRASLNGAIGMLSAPLCGSDDLAPLLSAVESNGLGISKCTTNNGPCNADEDVKVSFPNDWFRLGLIPAGSTDAIVISTTGTRDPVTSALHIILGKKMSLDIAQVVRWKTSPSSTEVPSVRYAASFAGYGFYGDVIKESEGYRWMGPKRYDFAGTVAFLKHRSYEAKVTFLKTEEQETSNIASDIQTSQLFQKNSKNVCRANCNICNDFKNAAQHSADVAVSPIHSQDSRWLEYKGRFLSVGAAIISCRNERAPKGLVAEAHLADGFLHLILIKDCPHPLYLWHLINLKRGSNPFDFTFVEHHKTPAFTFVSAHNESVWNVDGEILQACQVSVQVCRGLINLFASGPEV